MNRFVGKILFFFVRRLRGESVDQCIKIVRQVENFDKARLKKYQQNRLNDIIKNLSKKIPNYSKIKITDNCELKDFPILNKDSIKENNKLFQTKQKVRLSKRSTSGSTGTPFSFYKDRFSTAFMDAVMYHSYTWHGINIGDRQVRFWGFPISKRAKIRELFKDFLMNRLRMSAFEISDESMHSFYKKMIRFRPDYFYGYPSLIYEFACFAERSGLCFDHLRLKGIIVTGEQVVDEHLFKIEEIFHTDVIIEYGCTEVGIIAFQCPQKNMHIMSSNIIVEIIKDGRSVLDEEGKIVVSELSGNSMPFLRYELGDIGAISSQPCTCGLQFPVLKVVSGRLDSFILTPSGRKVYDAILAYTLKEGVKTFKAVQKTTSLLCIDIVKDDTLKPFPEKKYQDIFSKTIGNDVRIEFNFVPSIKREKSGKMRYFKSELKSDG